MNQRAIIIGSGLGGLACGLILAKNGYEVTVLEKEAVAGGCLQTFHRAGVSFDTGFHYVGGLAKGQPLYRLFNYFGLMQLPWHRMDARGFDRVILDGEQYLFSGSEFPEKENPFACFSETLASQFPQHRPALDSYARFLDKVGQNTFNSEAMPLFEQSAYRYLDSLSQGNTRLLNVLSGTSAKMELCAETLPLYTFAQINSSYIQSAWRLRGDSSLITGSLVQQIRTLGGRVLTGCPVTGLVEKNRNVTAVTIKGGETFPADVVVSAVHPAATMQLLAPDSAVRRSFRRRIVSLPNTAGIFTVHLALKPETVPYLNHNLFVHSTRGRSVWEQPGLMISCKVPEDGGSWAKSMDILCTLPWKEMAPWAYCHTGRRGASYLEFKERKAQECIDRAVGAVPSLRGGIERYYTTTPLSYRDYTGTPEGSAYGIRKDYNHTLSTVLAPRTPLGNLYLTGQSLNLHGVLGVSITALLTCSEILPSTVELPY